MIADNKRDGMMGLDLKTRLDGLALKIATAIHNDWENDGTKKEYFSSPKCVYDDPRAKDGACYAVYPLRVITAPTENEGKVSASVVRADCNVVLMDFEFDSVDVLQKDIDAVCVKACNASQKRDAE